MHNEKSSLLLEHLQQDSNKNKENIHSFDLKYDKLGDKLYNFEVNKNIVIYIYIYIYIVL